MHPILLIPLACLLVTVFVFSYVLSMGYPREPWARGFLGFAGASIGWQTLELVNVLPSMAGFEETIVRLLSLMWLPVGWLFLGFGYRVTGRAFDWIYWGSGAVTMVAAIVLMSTDLATIGYERYAWGVADVRNPLNHTAFCLVPVVCANYALWLIFRHYRSSSDPSVRKPMLLILILGIVTLSGMCLLNFVLPNHFGLLEVPRYGSSCLAVFIVAMYVAMTRYDLFGIHPRQIAEALFKDARDGVILAGRSGNVVQINQAALQLLNLPETPTNNLSMSLLLPGYSTTVFRNREFDLPHGDEVVTLAVTQSLTRPSSTDIDLILTLRDITEHKRAEEALREARDRLEEKAEDRIVELKQAQKLEAMGTLAGGIAHDFNNLLTPVIGYASAALDDVGEDHPVHNDLSEVLTAANQARDIIRQLLAFSRRDKPQRRRIELATVMEDALSFLVASLPSTITLTRSISDRPCQVEGDEAQLNQVVVNICANAYQAMGDMGGNLTVTLEPVELTTATVRRYPSLAPGPYVRLTIEDTGCGMPPDVLKRIFKPLYTTREDGSGLGLATVRRIVEDHHGGIAAQSKEGHGTTFDLVLPRIDRSGGSEP